MIIIPLAGLAASFRRIQFRFLSWHWAPAAILYVFYTQHFSVYRRIRTGLINFVPLGLILKKINW